MGFDVIETVRSLFEVTDAALEWLYAREWQIPFLIRAFDSVQQYFGEGTGVSLAMIPCHDVGGSDFWFSVILTQEVELAMEIEDRWWNEFWFEQCWRGGPENEIHPGLAWRRREGR